MNCFVRQQIGLMNLKLQESMKFVCWLIRQRMNAQHNLARKNIGLLIKKLKRLLNRELIRLHSIKFMHVGIVTQIVLGSGLIARQSAKQLAHGHLSLNYSDTMKEQSFVPHQHNSIYGSLSTIQRCLLVSRQQQKLADLNQLEAHGLNLMEMFQVVNPCADSFYTVRNISKKSLE